MTRNSKSIIYIKPIELTLDYSVSIADNLGNDFITELSSKEYDKLEQEYGEYNQEEERNVVKHGKYEGFEVGFIEYEDLNTSYSLFFNNKIAYEEIYKDIVQSLASNKLTIFFDYENITFDKHHLMFENEEIYQKLLELFDSSFTKLWADRRYLLKIEGVYDENNSNMLKWELSRIAAINFKTNKWSNWNPTSYSGFVRYENEELILVDKDEQPILNNDN